MGTQLDRVNGNKTSQEVIDDLRLQIHEMRQSLLERDELIEELKQRAPSSTYGISADGRAVVTPSEFARIHNTTVPTVNRALNNTGDGRRLQGQQLLNGHWLVYADQVFEPTHRGRRKNEK